MLNTVAFERDDWWDKNGAFRLLHDVNPLRLQWLQGQLKSDLRGKRLLDVGCGGGIFAEAAATAGATVCGLDAASHAITVARRHAEQTGATIDYYHGESVAELPAGEFDIITCFEMLEHVDEPQAVISEITQRLAPGGIAAFSTINRTLRAWSLMIVALEQVLKIIPHRTHDYAHFIQPAELARWCRYNNLAVRDVCGMEDSFFGHFYRLTAERMPVNYFLCAQRETA